VRDDDDDDDDDDVMMMTTMIHEQLEQPPMSMQVPATGDLHQEQVVRLELLNKLYMDCLDMNTQQYAQYYKDWMAYAAGGMRSGDEPSLPKTQTPPTPKQHETPPPPKVAAAGVQTMPLATLIEEEGSDDEVSGKRRINSL
jgi:hypothetical protein